MYNERYKNRLYGIGIRIVETGEVFETRTECAEHLGVSPSMVTMCLTGRTHTCRGYHLEVVDILIEHRLNEDTLDLLYSITGETCEWRDHPYRPNVYVSDTGLVARNVRGNVELRRQHLINSGYLVVSLGDKGSAISKNSLVLVHRLVAETFIPNDDPEVRAFVNHIDGDKTNNRVDNLEWCTRSENMYHANSTGLCHNERVMIVETGEVFNSASICARAIGGSVSGIHDCKSGRQRKHRGYHFKFLGDDGEWR